MTGPTLADTPANVPGRARRTEVLTLLRQADQPMSVAEVAESMSLHLNTARFHLDGLVEDGLAERTTEHRDTPGRPRVLYTAEGPSIGPRSYALLAEMLTGFISTMPNVGPGTAELGKAWGRHLIERAAPSEHVDADEAVTRLDRMLDAVGFDPEPHATESGVDVHLRRCPFREVAEKHTDVVCAIHLGLMQGALEEIDAPVTATALTPFVTPHLCVARIEPRAGS
ncbi:helix-turn-helix transcriptional regulator [Nocardioides sp.]|uniref:helix-turn-helix transcriptional regulator n=1 Tax=Nocardioides sp. TaxID=35761 RepID=UPI002ED8FF73